MDDVPPSLETHFISYFFSGKKNFKMAQMLKDTLIYGLCGFRSLKPQSGFPPGVILPSKNISTLSGGTVVVPTVGTLLASSGYRIKRL